MIEIIKKPAVLSTAHNALIFSVKTDNSLCRFMICKVFVESKIYENDFTLLCELASPPDNLLQTNFDLQNIFEDYFGAELGETNSKKPYFCKKTVIQYSVIFAELQGSTPTNETIIERFFVMQAKFYFLEFLNKRENLLPKYFILDEKPLIRTLEKQQIEFIYFLPIADENISVNFEIYYENNDLFSFTQEISCRKFEIFALPTGFPQQFYQKYGAGEIQKIVVSFKGYRITYEVFELAQDATYFLFANRLGGFDSLICFGDKASNSEFDKITSERIISDADRLGKVVVFSTTKTQNFQTSTGFLNKDEIESAEQIFTSSQVFVQEKTALIPIIINNKKAVQKSKKDYLLSFEFDYSYAF